MIPEGSSVGVGGSFTLSQIGFFDEARKRPIKLLNPAAQGVSQEEGVHSSPQRICSIYTVIAKKPLRTNMTVLIVGQPLGF
jgi:hypothetical protein